MGMVEFPIHPGDRVGDEVFTANDHGRPGQVSGVQWTQSWRIPIESPRRSLSAMKKPRLPPLERCSASAVRGRKGDI